MERNLALELVRVTEAAALASARWMGKGDGPAADRAAREAMALAIGSVELSGRITVGEANAESLSYGTEVGRNGPPRFDVAIDALQATGSVAYGRPNAISVIAVADRDAFFEPPVPYMNKIAVGPDAAGRIDITKSALDNLVEIADAKRCYVEDLTVCILDRERHSNLISQVRQAGARIRLIPDGDLAAAIATARVGSGIDVLMGIGGAKEAVLSAAALKPVGGDLQCALHLRDDKDAKTLAASNFGKPDRVLAIDDLIADGGVVFAATGVTNSETLQGVKFIRGGAITHSLVMRSKSGTVRFIETRHRFDKKPDYSG